jgi:hypothetical protein
LPIASLWFAQPGFQYGDRGFRQRSAPFLAALADHADVSTRTDCDILAFEPGHFGQTQTRLYRYQEKRVIAPAEPGALIGSGEQGIDLLTREEADQGPREALAGDGKHTLDLRGMGGCLEGRVTKERVNGGQAQITASNAQPSLLFQMIEKRHNQGGIDFFEPQARGRLMKPLLRILQEQTEGVAIGTDRMGTHLPLLHQALREETL